MEYDKHQKRMRYEKYYSSHLEIGVQSIAFIQPLCTELPSFNSSQVEIHVMRLDYASTVPLPLNDGNILEEDTAADLLPKTLVPMLPDLGLPDSFKLSSNSDN
jgi:hypothetical protein